MADINLAQTIDLLMTMEDEMLMKTAGKAMQAYNQKPTIANLKNWETAKNALEEYRRKKQQEVSGEIIFKDIPEVLSYLQSENYKISKSKLYEDVKFIKKEKDGSFSKKETDKYARQFLQKRDNSDTEFDPREKFKEETRYTKLRADRVDIDNEVTRGNLIPKLDVEQQMAARASYLKSSLEGFFNSLSPRIIEHVNGDMNKVPELTEFCLRELEELFHHYSKPLVFEVVKVIGGNGNDGE